jgi:hypothetical protein
MQEFRGEKFLSDLEAEAAKFESGGSRMCVEECLRQYAEDTEAASGRTEDPGRG